MPWLAYSQDTVMLTVYGHSSPKLEVTGYRIRLFIDEINTVCDPYTGKLTPEDQIRIFTDSLRNHGMDLSKFIYEGNQLRYPDYNDNHMVTPHPNVVKRYLLEDIQIHQIRDIQAMAKMLHIDIADVIPIRAYAKGVTKETMIKNALDNAKAQVDFIADAMQMRVFQLVEVHEYSDYGDPEYSNDIPFLCRGSVSIMAALVSR
jgi:hypothetical protein